MASAEQFEKAFWTLFHEPRGESKRKTWDRATRQRHIRGNVGCLSRPGDASASTTRPSEPHQPIHF